MTNEEAITFLQSVQPLPADDKLTVAMLEHFDQVVKHFSATPCEDAVPLLLNAIGDGSGFGVYQMVEDAIVGVESSQVVPHLLEAMRSPLPGVRYWSTQISASFQDRRLVPVLLKLAEDKDVDMRAGAVISLGNYVDRSLTVELRRLRAAEGDPEILEMYDDLIGDAQ